PVTATEYADALRVNIRQALEVLCRAGDVFQIRAAPIPERHVAELHAVTRATANVGLEDDIAHVHQELRVRIEAAEPLCGWATMHDDDGGIPGASEDIPRLVEDGGNLQAIE